MSTTIHRCGECNHQHGDHSRDVGRCSIGYCPCVLTVDQVKRGNPATEIPTFDNGWGAR